MHDAVAEDDVVVVVLFHQEVQTVLLWTRRKRKLKKKINWRIGYFDAFEHKGTMDIDNCVGIMTLIDIKQIGIIITVDLQE